jgi:hypothetical protein
MFKRAYFSFIAASLMLMASVVLCQAQAPTQPQPRQAWRASMSRKPLPKRGCFHAEYPSTEWTEVPCVSAPPPNGSGRELGPQTVGGGSDFVARSSSIIQTAVGSFPSVFGVTSESNAPYGPNAFSLQLNSNSNIPTDLCPNQGCAG